MSAQLRDYLLSNLGIVQYVPRDFCVADREIVEVENRTSQNDTESNADNSHSFAIFKENTSVTFTKSQVEATLTEESPVAQRQMEDTELRFRISYWQVSDLLVFSSLDYGENPPQDQHQLLDNILKAVNRLPGMLAEPELVDWPVVPTAPADKEAAKAMFTSLLKGRVEQTGSRWVLVMGQRAQQFLLSEPVADGKEYGRIRISEHCRAIVVPGLDQMLADPQSKRTAWQLLRFLVDTPTTC